MNSQLLGADCSMDFNEILIKLVHEQPCLYDHQVPSFKATKQKENVWALISEKIGESGMSIKLHNSGGIFLCTKTFI